MDTMFSLFPAGIAEFQHKTGSYLAPVSTSSSQRLDEADRPGASQSLGGPGHAWPVQGQDRAHRHRLPEGAWPTFCRFGRALASAKCAFQQELSGHTSVVFEEFACSP